MPYYREKALEYARLWAQDRNPRYYDFEHLGGDCTNFISQCLYAGCRTMNYTRDFGWYYNSLNDRSAAWTGVSYLYNFLTKNKGSGPYGHEARLHECVPGDIIQLTFDGYRFGHSLFVVKAGSRPNPNNILIATHTMDAYNRPLSSYMYNDYRLIHIDGARR